LVIGQFVVKKSEQSDVISHQVDEYLGQFPLD
jgi:hypothetical protein